MTRQSFQVTRMVILGIALAIAFSIGCSGGANLPVLPSGETSNPNSQIAPSGNPFAGCPVDEPYDNYTLRGESVTIDSSGDFQRTSTALGGVTHSVVPSVTSVRFDKTNSTASVEFGLYNDGDIIYDAHLVLDEILPSGSEPLDIDGTTPDGKPFWNFGIIPAGKTSPIRKLSIRFASNVGISVKGHIEFKERPYILWGDCILHTDGFDGADVKPNPNFGQVVSNEVIAGIPSGRSISEVYDYLVSKNLMPVGCDSALGSMELRILDDRTPEDVAQELEFDSYLVHPECNPILSIDYFPNDRFYNPAQNDDRRWAFQRVQAVETWDYYSDGVINQSGNANVPFGTTLAIVDTGMIKHVDFNLNSTDIWIMDNWGKNFITPGEPPIDDNGHGTNVAGIAGAMGNNEWDMVGMAWDPIFLPIKAFNWKGKASVSSIEYGLVHVRNFAIQYSGTRVIVNMSFGVYRDTPPYFWLGAALDYVNARPNTLLVAAAGNDKNDKNFYNLYNPDIYFEISADNCYPAAYPVCISVGASSRIREGGLDIEVADTETGGWGTNWGSTVDLCAPGIGIATTDNFSTTSYTPDDDLFGGTSAATPFVSGTAALIWGKNYSLTKAEVRQKILDNCDPMQTHGKALGAGRLNAYKIFNPAGNTTPTVSITNCPGTLPSTTSSYNFQWSMSDPETPTSQLKVEIKKDSGNWESLSNGTTNYTWSGFDYGNHTFQVRVTDNGSPQLSNTASCSFTRISPTNQSPTVSITNCPGTLPSTTSSYNFQWSMSDPETPTSQLKVEIKKDSGNWETLSNGTTNYTWSGFDYGNHTFQVRVTDNGSPVLDDTDTCNFTRANPSGIIKTIDLPDDAYGVYVTGGYGHVANWNAGLQIIDIEPPESAYIVKTVNTPGSAYDVYVSGGYAYIGDWYAGLQIIDVEPISSAYIVKTVDTPGTASGLHVSSGYAHLADLDYYIIDIEPPSSAYTYKIVDTPDYPWDVYVSGGYAYVADWTAGLNIVDIEPLSSAYIVKTVNTSGYACSVHVSSGYAYVADDGLDIIDIEPPGSAYILKEVATGGDAWGVFVSSGYAYVADHNAGLQIIDIEPPESAYIITTWDIGGIAQAVYVSGGYAYVTNYRPGKLIIIKLW